MIGQASSGGSQLLEWRSVRGEGGNQRHAICDGVRFVFRLVCLCDWCGCSGKLGGILVSEMASPQHGHSRISS